MSIFVGSTEINDILIGSTRIDTISVGSNKVFIRPLLIDLTVGFSSSTVGGTTTTTTGYTSSLGSISILNPPLWFGGSTINRIVWDTATGNPDKFRFLINDGGHANSDSVFKSIEVNGTTFNRSDADTYTNVNGVISDWSWENVTNPFGTTGSVNRIRIERDV
jgi:hypothetical protein